MEGIAAFIQLTVQIYSMIILARVLMSWVNIDPYSPLARFINDLTEPVLAPIRNLMPTAGGLDFSPIIAMILIQFLGQLLIMMLMA